MDIPVIAEAESKFTFGNGTPVRFYINGNFQFDVASEEQLETIRLWAFKNAVHRHVCFRWHDIALFITEHGALTSYPDQLFGHARRIYAEMIHIKQQRQELKN